MKSLSSLICIILFSLNVIGQNGSLKGTVTDKQNGELILGAKVILLQNNMVVQGALTDFDGKYMIKNVPPGEYDVEISYIGYDKTEIKGVFIRADQITFLDVTLSGEVELQEIMVVGKIERVSREQTIVRSDIARMPSSVSATTEHNTEEYNQIQDNQFRKVKRNPLSTFSIDVDRAAYSNVRRHLTDGQMPPADAVRVEEMINYFSYDYPTPEGKHPFSITTEYTDCPWNKGHKLVHIGLKGKEIDMKSAPANNLVFLIDVSGSMSSSDKLDLLKKGLYLLVDQLRQNDRVAIVVYASATGLVLPSTSGDHKDQIKSVIEQLDAGGSTAGGAGIKLAYQIAQDNFIQDGNNRVILATDGDFNVGVSSQGALVDLIEEKREDGVSLTVLGFGRGNLKDSKMEQIADHGNGNYNYIDNILEAKKVLVSEMGGTLVTIAKDVKIQTEFNPKHVKAYRLIGYVNRQLNDEDFNDDTKDAGELGSGHTVTVIYEIIPAGSKEKVNGSVDDLKYQDELAAVDKGEFNAEILTVKFRYKEPNGIRSKLITQVLKNKHISFAESSNDLQFAASVAAFGMLLRDSEFKGSADYEQVKSWAHAVKGSDPHGYRSEFIRLVDIADTLDE